MGEAEEFAGDEVPGDVADWLDLLALDLLAKGKRVDGEYFDSMKERGLVRRLPDGTQEMTPLGERQLAVSRRTTTDGHLRVPGPFPPVPDAF